MINNDVCEYDSCNVPIWQDSKCIFHHESDQRGQQFLDSFRRRVQDIQASQSKQYSFIGYNFPNDININKITGLNLDRHVDLSHAKFCGDANFVNITFQQGANFNHANFHNHANFNHANFHNHANFNHANFHNHANFNHANFHNRANFADTKFHGNASFVNTEFRGSIKFNLARFLNHANFVNTEFRGSTNFNRANFIHEAKFTGARFYDYATFLEGNIFPAGADFRDSHFLGIRAIFKTDVRELSFIGAILHNVDFTESKWQTRERSKLFGIIPVPTYKRNLCRDEADAKKPDEYKGAEAVCHNIKQCYQNAGIHETADEFHYGAMECRREQKRRYSIARISWAMLKYTSGYGTRPSRLLFSAIFIVVLFALIFSFTGIEINDSEYRLIFPPQFNRSQLKATLSHSFHCLYLSTVTFTVLGFGNYQPLPGLSQLFVVVEAFFGIGTMALFINTLSRKMTR